MSTTKRSSRSRAAAADPETPSPRAAPRDAVEVAAPALVLRGAMLVELSPPRLRRADLLITGGRIRGFNERVPPGATVLDCDNMIALPGLFVAEMRLHAGALRALPRSTVATFGQKLAAALWRYEAAMDPTLFRNAMTLGALEALRAGTTTVLHRHSSELAGESLQVAAEAIEATGLRAAIGVETSLRVSHDHARRAVRETEQFLLQRSKNSQRARVRGLVAADGYGRIDPPLAEELADLVARHQVPLLLSAGESPFDQPRDTARASTWLKYYGLVSEWTLACGGSFFDEEEAKALSDGGAALVMSLRSTRRLGLEDPRRIPSAERWLLGTGLEHPSLFAELDTAVGMQNQRGLELDAPALLAHHHNVWQQIHGAPFGRVDAGMVADLVVGRYYPGSPLTEESLPRHLGAALPGFSVVHAVVDGEVVLQDGRSPRLDEDKLRTETHNQIIDLLARL